MSGFTQSLLLFLLEKPWLQEKVKVSPFKLSKAKLGPGHTSGW